MFEKYTAFQHPQNHRRKLYGETGPVERGIVLLPPATWRALNRMAAAQKRSGSDIIASLINLANKAQGGNH